MGYQLGVDLGTTYTAAAVARDGRVDVVTLGNRQQSVPSVLFLKPDGDVLVGEAASRRGATEPERLAREFKRRLGDPTPLLLGGAPVGADALLGKLLRWVVERVVSLEGGPPDAIAVTHPANWGAFKLDLLQQAAAQARVGVARFLTEPEAAATSYASHERVAPGSVVAVYDLGGGTFDATVLRKGDGGFALLGAPQGIERLGGIDFDVAVFDHVWNGLGPAVAGVDVHDPAVLAAVARLRQECVEAKEALSADTDVSIPVVLPALQTEVRLTRAELESMIRPAIGETVVALRRALESAGVTPEQLSAVLLVGGSSRIPMVSQVVAGELGRPIAVDVDPKYAVCTGAALAAAAAAGGVAAVATPVPVPVAPPAPVAVPVATPPSTPAPAPAPTPAPAPVAPPAVTATPAAARSRGGLAAALLGLAALLGAAAFLFLSADDDGDGGEDATTVDDRTTTTVASTSTTDPFAAIEGVFVDDCVAGQPGLGDAADDFCRCTFTAIRDNIPFDRYLELEAETEPGGTPPAEIGEVIQPCIDEFS